MKKTFLKILTVVMVMAIGVSCISCSKEDEKNFLYGTQWQGNVTVAGSWITGGLSVTYTVGVEFSDNSNCRYRQISANTTPIESVGTYTIAADGKTITLNFSEGEIIETAIISSDGKSMQYKSEDSVLGTFTLTKR